RGRNTKVPQSGGSPNKVGDEANNNEMLDSVEMVAITASSLEAEQASGNINKNLFMATLNEPFSLELGSVNIVGSGEDSMEQDNELTVNVPPTPHDLPLSGGNISGSDEGSMELIKELMETCTSLTKRVLALEDAKTTQHKGRNDDKTEEFNLTGGGDKETLIKIKEEKAKEKGVVIKDVEDSSRLVRSITTLQPLPTIDPKDKGKGILQETESVDKTKKKVQGDVQMERDVEVALRVQEKLDEELIVEREKKEEASKVAIPEMFDEVQARMDDDYELATRMTQEEQKMYTIEKRARLLAEFFERRKKQLTTKRA
ncbi:hypothetical protein Tco_1446063, partial [Tanacetum coccineum]